MWAYENEVTAIDSLKTVSVLWKTLSETMYNNRLAHAELKTE